MKPLRGIAIIIVLLLLVGGGWLFWSVQDAGRDKTGVELAAPVSQLEADSELI